MRESVGFAGTRKGCVTDKGDEFPPPHGAPKAKDHDLTITPRIAARSGHLCPLLVKSGDVRFANKNARWIQKIRPTSRSP